MLITNFNTSGKMSDILSSVAASASSVWISSAYMSPAGCNKLSLQSLAATKPVHITIGRAIEEGLFKATHSFARTLHGIAAGRGGGVRCANPPSHSKIYAFELPGRRIAAWIGSSNLTGHGLSDWLEANIKVADPSVANAILREAKGIWASGLPLSSARIAVAPCGAREAWKRRKPQEFVENITEEPNTEGPPALCLSLLARDGQVQNKAGLNWWNGAGRPRDPNEAYVALPSAAIPQAGRVFGASTKGTVFQAIMHNGAIMSMMLEGSSTRGATKPKQICSAGDKKIFGKWILRDMLRLRPGTIATRARLETYGRTDICFHRIGTDPATNQAMIFVDFRP